MEVRNKVRRIILIIYHSNRQIILPLIVTLREERQSNLINFSVYYCLTSKFIFGFSRSFHSGKTH